MRENVRDPERLTHMLEAAIILRDKTPKYSIEEVRQDPILFYGIAKLLEIIGEAAYKITNEFKNQHPELPWKPIVGMRHVLVHDYYTMSVEKIWATVLDDIPEIIVILERYLKNGHKDALERVP